MSAQVSNRGSDEPARVGLQAPNAGNVLLLLTLANVLNFYDRTMPAMLVESFKTEWGLSDGQIGLLSSGFTVVYAVAGIILGRMADRGRRRIIMGLGLIVWSIFTALGGGAWSFASLLIARLGVGIGEAAYAPAANSIIADLYPSHQRARAIGWFQIGIPAGLIVAFFTTGAIVEAFDSWRAPFMIAAIPGFILGLLMMRIQEPARGASEPSTVSLEAAPSLMSAVRTIFAIPTMWWLILGGIGLQIVANGLGTFIVPFFERYFDLSLTSAGISAGIVLGFAQMIGLPLSGLLADRASGRGLNKRVQLGAIAMLVATPLMVLAFTRSTGDLIFVVVILALAHLLLPFYHTVALPALSDVVPPALRSTAIALLFAAFYLLGGGFGPVLVGMLSDHFAAGTIPAGMDAEAYGLKTALLVIMPIALFVTAVGLFGASRRITTDALVKR
jgi:MFS family permease